MVSEVIDKNYRRYFTLIPQHTKQQTFEPSEVCFGIMNLTAQHVIYSYKILNNLDKKEKIRACYLHACLKYVSNEKMTNQNLRERFKIEDQNAAIASRIISWMP